MALAEPTAARRARPRVPGPRGWPLLGNVAQLRGAAFHQRLLELHARYGDIFQLRFPGGGSVWVVRDPDALKQILQTHARRYIKGQQLEVARPLIGEGLFISEGEFWRRQRRLMQPAFVRPAVRRLAPLMARTIADDVVRRWEPLAREGRPLALKAEMMRLALQVVARTMFSSSLREDELRAVDEHFSFLLRVVTRRSNSLLYNLFPGLQRLPTPTNRRFRRSLAALEQLVYRLIADRRGDDRADDVVGMLLRARDEASGQGMSDKQLRDELITLFLAGHETTAIALTWALALLSRHPDLRRRLQAEVDAVLGDRLPTGEDFERLAFTRAFFDEVLRLYPPQVVMLRQAAEDDELAGLPVPRGQNLLLNIHGVHYHPAYWDNPQGVDPSRFPALGGPGPRHKFAYLPFGAGPRQCIGNHFAQMESVLALAIIHQRYELDLLPTTRLEPDSVGTLRPRGPVWVRVRARR